MITTFSFRSSKFWKKIITSLNLRARLVMFLIYEKFQLCSFLDEKLERNQVLDAIREMKKSTVHSNFHFLLFSLCKEFMRSTLP